MASMHWHSRTRDTSIKHSTLAYSQSNISHTNIHSKSVVSINLISHLCHECKLISNGIQSESEFVPRQLQLVTRCHLRQRSPREKKKKSRSTGARFVSRSPRTPRQHSCRTWQRFPCRTRATRSEPRVPLPLHHTYI